MDSIKTLDLTEVLAGRVVGICPTYGFIKVPEISKNVFFHRDSGVNNDKLLPKIGEEIVFFAQIDERGRLSAHLWAAASVLPPQTIDAVEELMNISYHLTEEDLLKYSGSMHFEDPLAQARRPVGLHCAGPSRRHG